MKKIRFFIAALLLVWVACVLIACEYSESDDESETEHIHSFVASDVIREATCTEYGERSLKCSCGAERSEAIPALGHDRIDQVKPIPTCTEAGWEKYTVCSRCDYENISYKLALGHAYGADDICEDCGIVYVDDGLVFELVNGESYAVTDCDNSAVSLNIPRRYKGLPVTQIGIGAFRSAKELVSLTIPETVTAIGIGAFTLCVSLESLTIPESVTDMGSGIFDGCKSLKNVTLPSNMKKIVSSMFSGCESLLEITIPERVTEIGENAFVGCKGLTEIKLPKSVKEIGSRAFGNCYKLESIEIPEGVTVIKSDTFLNCYKLTNIVLPRSLKTIESDAFVKCSIVNLYFTGTRTQWSEIKQYGGRYVLVASNYIFNYVPEEE